MPLTIRQGDGAEVGKNDKNPDGDAGQEAEGPLGDGGDGTNDREEPRPDASEKTQPEKAEPKEHGVQWEAEVYDSEKFVSDNTTVVKYVDWDTLEPSKEQHMKSKSSKGAAHASDGDEAEWKEPVVVMRYVVAAHMPWLDVEYAQKEEDSAEGCVACAQRKKSETPSSTSVYCTDQMPRTRGR
jgi:hypothetical protein